MFSMKITPNNTPKLACCAGGAAKRIRFLAAPWFNRYV